MILFSHPTGNANVRNAALGLQQAGLLGEFWTCINYRDTGPLHALLPSSLTRQLQRRTFPPELQSHLRAFPGRELGRLLAHRAGLRQLVRPEEGRFSIDAVYQSLDARVSRRLVEEPAFTGVYAYEDGAATTFARARERGRLTFYDLPIGYWKAARAILGEEAEREPEWAATLGGNRDSAAKTARKDEELRLADVVLVASSFTLKTLDDAPAFEAPVAVIPYGAPPPPADLAASERRQRTAGPLKVLFVGSLGQRKGLAYLFRACRQLGAAIELTIIGTKPAAACTALDRELAQYRWIASCPHAEILAQMRNHDVFVFPSLFEGFGLVLLEALAMGLPVITTAHTAGPDLITEGEDGFIVPIRSPEKLAEKLAQLVADPRLGRDMSEAAARKARQFTWENYRAQLAACVAQVCRQPAPPPFLIPPARPYP